MSWKIPPLYFFSSNNIYFAQKESIKVKILETFECSGQNLSNSLCQFWNDKSIPLQILYRVFFRVTNSTSQNIKSNFKLLTPRFVFYFFYFWVTNSKSKNKKLHFELPTQSQKKYKNWKKEEKKAWWWEKYLSKSSPLKRTCSWRDKLIVL